MKSNPKKFAFIAGDGIGVDVTIEALKVLRAVAEVEGLEIEVKEFDYGAERYLKTGEALPPGSYDHFKTYDAIYMGAFGDPRVPDMAHAREILLGTRFELDQYINFRPVRCFSDNLCPLKNWTANDIDFVVFRENTEGLYVGVGGIFKKGTPDEIAIQEQINTRKGVERIIRAAFEFAKSRGRSSVTMADKSNALRFGHDLWLRTFAEVAAEYPEIENNHMYIDAMAMALIRDPSAFEVIVTCNLFGDIITDLGAQLQGGMGMAGSGNINPEGTSMFEPVHGSAPDIVGQDVANPFAAILTVAMMLEHCGETAAADRIEQAVRDCLAAKESTVEVGGSLGTKATGDAVARRVRKGE